MDSEDRTTPVSVEERSEPPSGPAETPPREPAPEDADQSMIGTMQGLLSDTATEFRTLQRGDVVEGVVVSADRDGVLVDIGMKSEGIVPTGEAQGLLDRDEIRVGEEVLVYVIQPEDQEGHVVLSLNRARSERGWRTMQRLFDEGQIFESGVIDHNKGGLIVDADGVRGFIPLSQVAGVRLEGSTEDEIGEKLAAMVGQSIPVKVLEINRRRNRLILSERQAVQERRGLRKEQLIAELKDGEVRHGRVSSLCDFGAFVDLGGADGLVHLSELAWRQVSHPREVLQVGQEVDVYVLNVDREKKKIALSLRRLQPEPWSTVSERYVPGDIVHGTITKLATFGAFARVEDGIEGLIHISELGEGHIVHPRNVVKEGDQVTLRVLRVEPERRRLALSLRQVEQPDSTSEPEPAE
jgi:small subunit ribosomal protein S1